MADQWEEDEFDVPVPSLAVVKKSTWEDEDADNDDIRDSWEDAAAEEEEDDDENAATKSTTNVPPPIRKKVPLAQRIAERNAENERRKQELAERVRQNVDEMETEEEAFEKKMRLRALEQEADLENATDLFSGVSVSKEVGEGENVLLELKPSTKEEFDCLANALVKRLQPLQKHGLYAQFLTGLVHQLADPLKDVDIRKISSSLTALSNEKQKATKDKTKKKGGAAAKKPIAKAGPVIDTTNYGQVLEDDFGDFM